MFEAIASLLRAKTGPEASPWEARRRASICVNCQQRDSTGQRLFRIANGKYFCGRPANAFDVTRDLVAEGCGCDLGDKVTHLEAQCPRGMW